MLNASTHQLPHHLLPVRGKRDLIADQLKRAKEAGLLVTGLQKVWKHCRESSGWVIIDEGICNCHAGITKFNIDLAIENIIDEVIDRKGIVEIVDANILKQYGQIVMIIKDQK
jgi:hypothetical protein